MAIVPIRDLGKHGVNTDFDPLDLPSTTFSYGANVRFVDNKITRGPVLSFVGSSSANAKPRWSYSYRLQGASSTLLVMNQDGSIASVSASTPGSPLTYTSKSIAGYTPSEQTLPFTSCMLANVVYANREDRVPWSIAPAASQFSTLTGWDSTWRCKSLRAFNGALVAINVTKGATSYPTMVKTSDFALFGTVPGTWVSSTTNSASENVLADLSEPLVDGWPLRDRFMLYTPNETWVMTPTGDNLIYSTKRLFSNYGAISTNCVAEVNNVHYVFGDNDIWMHDGYSPKSISTGRVRKFIFNNLLRSEAYQFFVWSNPRLNEVMFCYVSQDPKCAYLVNPAIGYPGCNKAAVYNWMYDTWSFYDLPYIVGGGLGTMSSGLSYDDLSGTSYDSISSTYTGLFDSSLLYNLAIGRGGSVTTPQLPMQSLGSWDNAKTHLYSFETLDSNYGGSSLVDVVVPPVYLENIQMDMDEVSPELRGYKVITSIYPEGRMDNVNNPLTFWTGSVDYSGQTIAYGPPMTFDGQGFYKLDYMNPGRYLSLKMAQGNPPNKFSLSGMDLEYKVFAHR